MRDVHIEFGQLQAANFQAQSAKDLAHESARVTGNVRKDTERLYLIVQALWELLRENTNLTDEDLQKKVREIDLRDGREDGQDKTQTRPSACKRCGRVLEMGTAVCLWCGTPVGNGVFAHIGK